MTTDTDRADLTHWLELEDLKYRASLVQQRIASGLTVDQISTAMGRSHVAVAAVEDFTIDPRLSTLRRYAAAVGALTQHRVVQLPDLEPAEEATCSDDATAGTP